MTNDPSKLESLNNLIKANVTTLYSGLKLSFSGRKHNTLNYSNILKHIVSCCIH